MQIYYAYLMYANKTRIIFKKNILLSVTPYIYIYSFLLAVWFRPNIGNSNKQEGTPRHNTSGHSAPGHNTPKHNATRTQHRRTQTDKRSTNGRTDGRNTNTAARSQRIKDTQHLHPPGHICTGSGGADGTCVGVARRGVFVATGAFLSAFDSEISIFYGLYGGIQKKQPESVRLLFNFLYYSYLFIPFVFIFSSSMTA